MRPYISLLFLLCCTPLAAAGLTEAQAVQRGMAVEDIQIVLEARRAQARGRTEAAGRWDNPEIEYSREELDVSGGESEERFWWLRQRLHLAGSKGLQRDAAGKQALADDARTLLYHRDLLADIRTRYYRALAADDSAQTIAGFQNRLQELASFVQQRLVAGDASRYDQLRLQQELALIESDLQTARAEADAAREQLFGMIGGEAEDLTGTVLPPDVDDLQVERALQQHPLLQALHAESESEALAGKAARREVWPAVTLGIGRQEVEEAGLEADGSAISLGVEIPLFDRGSGKAQIAESRSRQRQAEYSLALAQLSADLRSTHRSVRAQRSAALGLRPDLPTEEASLTEIAESAYNAGEVSIMELIDAHRSELGARQAFIERALSARNTYIELQRLREKP